MALTLQSQSRITLAPDLLASNLDGEVVILHVGRGQYYSLDKVGAYIWGRLAEPTTVQEVYEALLEDYDAEPERCRGDLLALLEQLAGEGLIEVRNETAQ